MDRTTLALKILHWTFAAAFLLIGLLAWPTRLTSWAEPGLLSIGVSISSTVVALGLSMNWRWATIFAGVVPLILLVYFRDFFLLTSVGGVSPIRFFVVTILGLGLIAIEIATIILAIIHTRGMNNGVGAAPNTANNDAGRSHAC